jgi:hypothetical protein
MNFHLYAFKCIFFYAAVKISSLNSKSNIIVIHSKSNRNFQCYIRKYAFKSVELKMNVAFLVANSTICLVS